MYFLSWRLVRNVGKSVLWVSGLTPRLVCHCDWRLPAIAVLEVLVLNQYTIPTRLVPVGSHVCRSALALFTSKTAVGSLPSPRYPWRPLLITPPVAGLQVMPPGPQATLTSWVRSIASEKARRPARAMGSSMLPPAGAKGPVLKLKPTQVVRPPGMLTN